MSARIDHIVVAAASLQAGVDWCEATLGVTPGPGGAHPLMGTHNRLFGIGTPRFPLAYFEIIAIDPAATPQRAAGLRRWFDLDDTQLQDTLARSGPQIVHLVASVPDASAAVRALHGRGIDRGAVLEASRMTPAGLLQWRITVRDDGQRLFYGALPTLIEWGEVHPARGMPDSGVTLEAVDIRHPRPGDLSAAWQAAGIDGLDGVQISAGKPNLAVVLRTPRGVVTLSSNGH